MASERAYAYMWEYNIKTEFKMTFEEFYGPNGRWVELFKKAEGYIGTELLHDELDSQKYITIDYWRSRTNRNDFLLKFSDEYKALDTECAMFTLSERYVGEFDSVSSYK